MADRHCLPYTIGRGYCSIDPRHRLVERYRRSAKDKLVLLILSDLDPDGEEIAHSFARSLRDDFVISPYCIEPIKVAITPAQVPEYGLNPVMSAKPTSSNYARYFENHGTDVFELEALEPGNLNEILTDAIRAVLDLDAFNAEINQEQKEAARSAGDFPRVHGLNKG